MGRMYVGTIHGYCYRVLTEHRVEVGNHEVLDEHRHQAFVHRHRKALNSELSLSKPPGKVPGFEAAAQFISAVDAAGNELLSEASFVGSPFQDSFRTYR
jgi:DNA helicase-2/ATP-dependent DNA helicase PcrA